MARTRDEDPSAKREEPQGGLAYGGPCDRHIPSAAENEHVRVARRSIDPGYEIGNTLQGADESDLLYGYTRSEAVTGENGGGYRRPTNGRNRNPYPNYSWGPGGRGSSGYSPARDEDPD